MSEPRVEVDQYIVYPSCWDQMGNVDRDAFCLMVQNGYKWGLVGPRWPRNVKPQGDEPQGWPRTEEDDE